MKIEKLSPNPDNPRIVTPKKLAMLQKALQEFGDLSGIVFNRRTQQLVGGHQRVAVFKAADAQVIIERKFKKPTAIGTVAEGHILIGEERFAYREVDWDEAKEKAANLAANKGAGSWDLPKLRDFMVELKDFSLDINLTMFDELEARKVMREKDDGGKEENARVASDNVKTFQLTFDASSADEFKALVEYFRVATDTDSVSDTVLEVLRAAKVSAES